MLQATNGTTEKRHHICYPNQQTLQEKNPDTGKLQSVSRGEARRARKSYGVYTGTESFGNAVNQTHSDQNLPNSSNQMMLYVCKL